MFSTSSVRDRNRPLDRITAWLEVLLQLLDVSVGMMLRKKNEKQCLLVKRKNLSHSSDTRVSKLNDECVVTCKSL